MLGLLDFHSSAVGAPSQGNQRFAYIDDEEANLSEVKGHGQITEV